MEQRFNFTTPHRVTNRQTTWYLINIKARRNQTTQHYIDIFRRLQEEDPLVDFARGGNSASLKRMTISQTTDESSLPRLIELTLLQYTIIDKDAFYNRRSQEDISMEDWNDDIVANKREADLFFIPSVHHLAVRCNSKISLNNIVHYFSSTLNRIEPDAFDVDVVKDRNTLDRILTAHAITKIQANISYSNHGHTDEFTQAFLDEKMRETGASRVDMTLTGSREYPMNCNQGGIIKALVNLSEHNGSVKATIQATENGGLETIDTNAHPSKITIPQIVHSIGDTIYNFVRTLMQ